MFNFSVSFNPRMYNNRFVENVFDLYIDDIVRNSCVMLSRGYFEMKVILHSLHTIGVLGSGNPIPCRLCPNITSICHCTIGIIVSAW